MLVGTEPEGFLSMPHSLNYHPETINVNNI